MRYPITIEPDAFGWFLIRQRGQTLQAFRSKAECRQWIAETARFRSLFPAGQSTPHTHSDQSSHNTEGN